MINFVIALLMIWLVPAILYGIVGQVMDPKSNGVHFIKGLKWPSHFFGD